MIQNKQLQFAEPERTKKGEIFAVSLHFSDRSQIRFQSKVDILSIVSDKADGSKMGALPLFHERNVISMIPAKDEKGEIKSLSFEFEDKQKAEIASRKGIIEVFAYDDESKKWGYVHPCQII